MHLFVTYKPIRAIIIICLFLVCLAGLSSAANNPPVIQPISDQEGYRPTEVIIEIEDFENDVINLWATSSDTNVVPQSNIFISGAGANWTLSITPEEVGNTIITVFADDNNGNAVSTAFNYRSYPIFSLPENVTILPGTFTIPLTLNNAPHENIYGIEFTIAYDPLVINATDFHLSEPKLIDNYLIEYNAGIDGQIIVCIASNNSVYTGTGQFGHINFETISYNQTSPLSFTNARFNEWSGLTNKGEIIVHANQAPSISNIANVSIDEDTQTSVIFTVDDLESSPCSVTLQIDSDNTLLAPLSSFSSACSNNTYTLVIIPEKNQHGLANISLTATDNENLFDIEHFTIEVISINDAPHISEIENIIMMEDTTRENLSFNISDIETLASDLNVSASSSNTLLVSVENIVFGGTDENRTMKITPSENQNGTATITINVSDTETTVRTDFMVTVTADDDPPEIALPIADIDVDEDAENYTIDLSSVFIDIDNENQDIVKTIHNITNTDIVSGSIVNNILTLTFAKNQHGNGNISIVGSSNGKSVTDTFAVNVKPVNDLPEMTPLIDLSTYESTPVTQTFIASDIDSADLMMIITVSDPQLLPYNNISFTGGDFIDIDLVSIDKDTPIEIHMKPAFGQSGKVTITLKIKDGAGGDLEQSFDLTIKKYQITAIAEGNGNIVPSGIVAVNTNTPSITFQLQPYPGYMIDSLVVDSQLLSARPTYTFRNVSDDHAITAVFREPKVYTISTQVNYGGSVTPDGMVQVSEGQSQKFEIQKTTGFDIDYLMVDGKYVASVNEYTFDNVNANHALEVFYKTVPSPEAGFDISVNSGSFPLVVNFIDTSTNMISSRFWDFGDGSSNSLKNPQHTYFEPGTYTVTLKVQGQGGTDTLVKKNLIKVYDIQMDYTATPSSGAYPLTVTFAPEIPDHVTQVVWVFGDGETSTQVSPSHVYHAPGEYTTRLTAYADGTAMTVVKQKHINVKGRNISGRVTAADTGLGLAGYQVEIIQRQYSQRVGETYTDENGDYSFICEPSSVTCLTVLNNIPAASDLILAVWPPFMNNNYYMQYYSNQSMRSKATLISTSDSNQDHINIVMEKPLPLIIKGQVHDNGVTFAHKQVSAYSEKLAFGLNTMTDENGAYTLSGLKSSDDYRIYVWGGGDQQNSEIYYAIPSNATPGEAIPTYSVYSWDAATQVDLSSGTLEHIDIVLDHSINKRGTIQGQLKIDNQQKAENIWVYAFSEELNFGNGAFTDENGYYTITALSEISESDPITMGYVVAVHSIQYNNLDENPAHVWYTYQAYPGVSDKLQAQPVKTDVTGIDFMLITQCQITGTVMDIYHTPVPNADVTVNSEKAGMAFSSAVTDETGKYAFTGLPPVNDYIVTVTAPDYPITYYKDQSNSAHAEKIDLSKGNVGNIDFKLDTGMVIRGIVFQDNAQTIASEGLWVNIWSKSTQTGGDVRTDINGQYQIVGLNPNANDYIISIRIDNYMPAFYRDNHDDDLMNDTVYLPDEAQGIAPSTLQWAENKNLILRAGLSISGQVLHNGLPVSGIEIEAISSGGWDNDISKGFLSDNHNYKLSGLPPGEYTVKIKPLNFLDDSYRVELVNEDITNIIFPLKDLESRICGTVYGLKVNQHAQIVAWAEEKGYNHTFSCVSSGEAIRYTLPVKPFADYQVKFTAGNGYPDQWYNDQTSADLANIISISEEIVSGIDFHVSSGSQVISGTINFPISAETGDIVWIDAHSPATGSNGSAEVILYQGHTANYEISGLKQATDFIVVAWGKNYQEQYYDRQPTENFATLVNTSDAIPDNAINFDMNPGASISGFVYQDENPANDWYIEAFSESASSFGGHSYIDNGNYVIEGLDQASDYIIKVYKIGMAPFYYHTSGYTREVKLATKVSTLENKHVSGINILTFQFESISGIVRDEEGKALSDIWVNVWSNLKKCGEGIYTGKDGGYQIDGLSKSDDYIVSIDEHADLTYIPEEKTNVKSGSSGVNFLLRKAFHLKGTVVNTSKEPVVKAQVELYSDNENFDVWTRTDASGTFNIKCVPSAKDYVLSVMPHDEDILADNAISYVKFTEAGLAINDEHTTDYKMEKEIILKPGSFIIGHIYKSDATTPIKDALISVYSPSKGQESSENTTSNNEGFYQINNIPIGSDYIVSVTSTKTNYAKSTKVNQQTGTTVDFILNIGGSISGRVLEAEGAFLSNVLVDIVSDTASFDRSTRTDADGNFTFTGLPRYLENGQDVDDYVVKITPEKYPAQSQGQKQIGEFVTFVCKKGNEITGVITDSQGTPIPENVVVSIKAFNKNTQGGFETKTGADSDSKFVINNMLFNQEYQLKVVVLESKIDTPEQWIDINGFGVSGRNKAGSFMTGSHITIRLDGIWSR